MKVLQRDLNYTKFRCISLMHESYFFANPILWPYLTRDNARHSKCKPVLADGLLFSCRQIRGGKIDPCNSGIIQLTKWIINPLTQTWFSVEHLLLNSLSLSSSLSLPLLTLSLFFCPPFTSFFHCFSSFACSHFCPSTLFGSPYCLQSLLTCLMLSFHPLIFFC